MSFPDHVSGGERVWLLGDIIDIQLVIVAFYRSVKGKGVLVTRVLGVLMKKNNGHQQAFK